MTNWIAIAVLVFFAGYLMMIFNNNESVNNNNVRIDQFPDVLMANFFNFKAFELLEFQDEELKDVSIKELFN